MGLLAELSILVHPPAGQPVPSDQAAWDAAFLDQIALVTVKFKEDKRVRAITSLIFDASRADLSKLSADEIARSKRVGYATFRWKSR
jgi:hypothetical protein